MNVTPGEWKASHPLDNITYIGNQDGTIAKVQWFEGIPLEEQEANANLFTTSNAMYEALVAVLKEELFWEAVRLSEKTKQLVINAITKAEGRA